MIDHVENVQNVDSTPDDVTGRRVAPRAITPRARISRLPRGRSSREADAFSHGLARLNVAPREVRSKRYPPKMVQKHRTEQKVDFHGFLMLATRPRQTHLRASLRVMAPTRLTVVLVGQTGNGKSATGNSLLGRDAFVARRSLQSVTERCRVRYAALDADDEPIVPGDPAVGVDEDAGGIRRPSTVLRVVDTPGTCDSGALLEDNLRHISAFLRGEERVDESTADDDDDDGAEAGAGDEGLHALVLVLSAATRFTQEEAVALERLVQRLGEGVMRDRKSVV